MTDSVEITDLSHGGRAVGRVEGKVVFVPYGVPGDVVRLEGIEDRGRFCEARIAEVLTPSPHRVAWDCPVFGSCGGCCWLHIDPQIQREWKARMVGESLARIGHIEPPQITQAEPPSPALGYRGRAGLQCRWTAHGYEIGFNAQGSRRVIDIDRCPLLTDGANEVLAVLRRALCVPGLADGIARIDVCHSPDDGKASVLLFVPPSRQKRFGDVLKGLSASAVVTEARFGTQKGTRGAVHFKLRGLTYRVSPHSFFQANVEGAPVLLDTVMEMADPRRSQVIVDLYSGVGFFTLPLARRAKHVIGVEGNPDAVADARANARKNGVARADFHALSVSGDLTALGLERADTVVLDPPREGAKEALPAIAKLRPDRIVYVSCDPATLARDAAALAEAGYVLRESVVVDMFPATPHVESVNRFEPGPG